MSVQTFQGLSIFLGAENIACRAKTFEAPVVEFAKLDATALCDTWERSIAGTGSWTWNGEVMQDHDTNEIDQIVWPTVGSAVPLTLLPDGTANNAVAYMGQANVFSYAPVMATRGEIAMASVGSAGTGPAIRGQVAHASATRTANSVGNENPMQLGAVSASQRIYGALHVTAASGTSPTLAVIVQSAASNTFSGATTRLAFTTATGLTSQWLSAAGAITDTWWRVVWTVGGTSPSFTFTVALGIGVSA